MLYCICLISFLLLVLVLKYFMWIWILEYGDLDCKVEYFFLFMIWSVFEINMRNNILRLLLVVLFSCYFE